jgi:hypothetical protein
MKHGTEAATEHKCSASERQRNGSASRGGAARHRGAASITDAVPRSPCAHVRSGTESAWRAAERHRGAPSITQAPLRSMRHAVPKHTLHTSGVPREVPKGVPPWPPRGGPGGPRAAGSAGSTMQLRVGRPHFKIARATDVETTMQTEDTHLALTQSSQTWAAWWTEGPPHPLTNTCKAPRARG